MPLSLEEQRELLAQLRALCRQIADDAAPDDAAPQLIDLGGSLFDAHYLDGQQYSAIYDLSEAIKKHASDVRTRADQCLAVLIN